MTTLRLPVQVLVLLWRRIEDGCTPAYLLLHRRPERYAIWQPVTGGVHEGETPSSAALREIEEETGFEVEAADLMALGDPVTFSITPEFSHLHPVGTQVTEYPFSARVGGGPPALSGEHDDYKWCQREEAVRLLHWASNRESLLRLDRELTRRR